MWWLRRQRTYSAFYPFPRPNLNLNIWWQTLATGAMCISGSGVLDVVLALAGLDGVDEASEMTACVVDASFLGVAHPVLDLGEGLLDGVEVR